MPKTSADLLQALLDRQKAERREPSPMAPADHAPTPAMPAPTAASAPKPEPSAAPLPIVEIKPRGAPVSAAGSPRGITLTFPMFVAGLVTVGVLLVGAFLLGRWSVPSNAGGQGETGTPPISIPRAPSVPPFEWAKKFTVEALSLGTSDAEKSRLIELSKYLGKQGVVSSAVEVREAGKASAALFLGATDTANEKSLVKLRDWLREIPGPDGTGRPFQSARIREIPRRDNR